MNFNDFVEYIFNRPEDTAKPWYFADGFIGYSFQRKNAVQLATRVFLEIGGIIENWADKQIANGLTYLISAGASDIPNYYFVESVDPEIRCKAIQSMTVVYEKLFMVKCGDLCSFESKDINDICSLCYMWWHILPRHGLPYQEFNKRIDSNILKLLDKMLYFDSAACKEAALHGLGHWQQAYPEMVSVSIDNALKYLPDKLKNYANYARVGRVQ
jgi:hypothetical protein